MSGSPNEENSNTLGKPQAERPANANCESAVREITQTDHLNRKLLMSLLERMNKSDGELDKFMEKGSANGFPVISEEESDF